jgi:hypothetical protein
MPVFGSEGQNTGSGSNLGLLEKQITPLGRRRSRGAITLFELAEEDRADVFDFRLALKAWTFFSLPRTEATCATNCR